MSDMGSGDAPKPFSKSALSLDQAPIAKSSLSYLAILGRGEITNIDDVANQAIGNPKDSRLPRSVIDHLNMEEKEGTSEVFVNDTKDQVMLRRTESRGQLSPALPVPGKPDEDVKLELQDKPRKNREKVAFSIVSQPLQQLAEEE